MNVFDDPYKLVLSNLHEWAEFDRLGLGCGVMADDIAETEGTRMEVILHKARDAGPFTVCEDTSVDIEGTRAGLNVRWLLDRIGEPVGRRAEWRTMLAVNDGDTVSVYEGVVEGEIRAPGSEQGFGFDAVFAPRGFDGLTLSDLGRDGRRDEASARARAVQALRESNIATRTALADIAR